ncbi:MAG: hypothetical protein EXR75_10150 [Myxococcales bacterium]|nr:hypothetical protein [Myxococcales bacterium]
MLPSGLLDGASERLFRYLDVEPGWLRAVEEAASRGPVVYVLRHVSALDFLALRYLTHRHDLPRIAFANELPNALATTLARVSATADPVARLTAALSSGHSAVLFIQRAPERQGMPRSHDGAELLHALLELVRKDPERRLTLVPQVLVWTRRAEKKQRFSLLDSIFGSSEFPGDLRQLGQIFANYHGGRLRLGEPVDLASFLAEAGTRADEPRPSDAVLVRRLSYALLRKVERERRTIVGPAHKSPERVRDEVLRSPRLQRVVRELAGPSTEHQAVLFAKAREHLAELQTIPDPEAAESLEAVARRVLERIYSGIDVDEEGVERLRAAARDGSVVLLPCHKSHIDYILLSYVLRSHSLQLPVIAAGENLAFFPVGPLLRRGGAFFIRRSFAGDRLYTAIVDAYMRRLLREGWLIEFFLEGGRSRTGTLLAPKLGLLNMVVAAALSIEHRRVSFFPISIGYERLIEEGAFARELAGGEKHAEDAGQLLLASRLLSERWGRANIQFGRAIELRTLRDELGTEDRDAARLSPARRRALVKRLAHQVMHEINRVTALTPGAVVALALLGHGRHGVAYRELLVEAARLTRLLLAEGARATPSLVQPGATEAREAGLVEALRLYVRGGLVAQHVPGQMLAEQKQRARLYTGVDVIFTVPENKRVRLDFAKNHILHFLVDRALVAVALTSSSTPSLHPERTLEIATLRVRVLELSRLFKREFMFRADAAFEQIFDDVLGGMLARGELVRRDDLIGPGAGHEGLDGDGWLDFYAATLRNYFEAYVVAARGLEALLKGPLSKKELVMRALKTGQRMFLRGEIERAEAVARTTIENAFEVFVEQGYLVREKESLRLSLSFESPEGVRAVEGRIRGFYAGD